MPVPSLSDDMRLSRQRLPMMPRTVGMGPLQHRTAELEIIFGLLMVVPSRIISHTVALDVASCRCSVR